MNTTELRESFKHIHAYQNWQRQCEALADEIDRLRGLTQFKASLAALDEAERLRRELDTLDRSHKDLSHRLAESGADNEQLRAALEFYADPAMWKKKHDPDSDIQIPDFYSETDFGAVAYAALSRSNPSNG